MTSYHHPYPSTQASSVGWEAMQPYRARASDFWYKLAWLLVGVLAVLGSAFSLYRNGILLKLARDWGAEQTYLSFERSLLGGPYWGTPSFEMPMPSVAELASSQLPSVIAVPFGERLIPSEVPAPTATQPSTNTTADSRAIRTATQEHEPLTQEHDPPLTRGTAAVPDSSSQRVFADRSPSKARGEASTRSEAKGSKSEATKVAPSRTSGGGADSASVKPSVEVTARKESASSKLHAEASTQKESAPSKAGGEATAKRAPDPNAASRAAETSAPAAAVSKPAPARKENPLDAAIRAAIGK